MNKAHLIRYRRGMMTDEEAVALGIIPAAEVHHPLPKEKATKKKATKKKTAKNK